MEEGEDMKEGRKLFQQAKDLYRPGFISECTGRASLSMPSTSTRLEPLKGDDVVVQEYERGKGDISARGKPLSTWPHHQ
jgi:hypothetical protein